MSSNFQKRNESDIFFTNSNIHHSEVYKPLRDYYTKYHQGDHLSTFITRPSNSNKENLTINTNDTPINNIRRKKKLNQSASDIFNVNPPKHPPKSLSLPKNHHLNKSSIFPEENYEEYKVKFDRSIPTIDHFKGEETAYQRKMEDIYGKNSEKLKMIDFSSKFSTKNQMLHEIQSNDPYITKTVNEKKYASNICISVPSNLNIDINRLKKPNSLQTEKEEKFDARSALISKIAQLKSNIFNDPDKDFINKTALINYKEKELNVAPIKRFKRPKPSSMNSSFDWKDSANETWLSRYKKDLSTLTAKERRINDNHGSLDGDLVLSHETPSLAVYDKNEKISQTKKFYSGRPQSQIRRQIDNISALTNNEFIDGAYQCNDKDNKEIIHSYQIDHIKESDLVSVKQCFHKNGIHIFDTALNEFSFSGEPGKVTMKVRENPKDKNFRKNFLKAQEELKKEKGYDVISAQSNQKKKYVSSLPKNLKWNDVHLNSYTKNRFESSNNQKTHSKALTSQNSKVTLVPYNNKYKNKILPYKK